MVSGWALARTDLLPGVTTLFLSTSGQYPGKRLTMRHEGVLMRMCGLTLIFSVFMALPGTSQEHAPATRDTAERSTISVVLFPKREAVLSSQVSATVVSILKEKGEAFKAGAPLIELDATLFKARKKKAEVDHEAAQAELAATDKLYQDRSKSLVQLMHARREAAQAEMNLTLATHALESCTIRAPYDGSVRKTMVEEHELVQQGQDLIEIVDDTRLRAKFLAPANAREQIRIGATVKIQLDQRPAPLSLEGTITHIDREDDPASGTFEVYAEVANQEGLVKSGLIGRLAIADLAGE